MANIGDGFKDIFFAGIGALAITGEKAKEVVDQLIAKGEITVDQGKQINSELTRKVSETATNVRYATLEAVMPTLGLLGCSAPSPGLAGGTSSLVMRTSTTSRTK